MVETQVDLLMKAMAENQARLRIKAAQDFVATLPDDLRKDLRPYAITLVELYSPLSDSLSRGRQSQLMGEKTTQEGVLADKYAGGDTVSRLNDFLLENRLNLPEIREALASWLIE